MFAPQTGGAKGVHSMDTLFKVSYIKYTLLLFRPEEQKYTLKKVTKIKYIPSIYNAFILLLLLKGKAI
jgi:hypothetical protein